jgi:signal transduction histidine kinase
VRFADGTKKKVFQHGGKVAVESEKGFGSRFRFTLPADGKAA